MASGFPASIDNFTDPLSNSPLNSPSHSALHTDVNDAVEKLETYMGLVKVIPTGATNGTVGATGTVTIGSAVSSVAVAGAFSSLYENYLIIMSSPTFSADAAISIILGASVTGYYGFLTLGDATTSTVQGAGRNNTAQLNWVGGGRSGQVGQARVEVIGPFIAQHTKFLNGAYQNGNLYGTMQGEHRVSTSYTGFTLFPDSGTLTGGTITVYGYRQ
jgi:hypothetical protein